MSRPLRHLLIRYELAFLVLLLVTGALAGLWAYYWQTTSAELVRLGHLRDAGHQIRTDMFRQIKEVTWARLKDDPEALQLFVEFSRKIDKNFSELDNFSTLAEEKQAVTVVIDAYRVIGKDMNKIFTDPYMMNRMIRLRVLDPAYERNMVSVFEQAYDRFQSVLDKQQNAINSKMTYWTNLAPLLIPIPLILAGILFLFSRASIQRQVVQPVEIVRQGAAVISKGEFNHHVPEMGVKEMVDLAGTINEMAAELARSRDALIESEKQAALGQLVPVVAHNIRNPLASIRASAQLLEHVDDLDDKREIKDAILETVDRLTRWVSALVSYLHPLKPHPKITTLTEMLQAIVNLLETRLEQKNVQIVHKQWDEKLVTAVDPDLMEQALYGLLSNAVDASPDDAEVDLSVFRNGADIDITISDDGAGMPFDPKPAELAPGHTTKRFGTGLGIPVAFKVCNTHGWKLSYEKRDPNGTRVRIKIPRGATQSQESGLFCEVDTAHTGNELK